MSDFTSIFALRSAVETGCKAAIAAATDKAVYIRTDKLEEFQNIRPRYELKANIGQSTGHRNICADGFARYDTFRVSIAVQIVTQSTPDKASDHETMIAAATGAMSNLHALTYDDATNWPMCFLAVPLRNAGIASTLKTAEGVEYSTIEFQGVVQIRPASWPVET